MKLIATLSNSARPRRSAFTLVELLIVITIMLLLMTMTVYSVNFARDSDRASSSASKIQSYLAGARDRAIYTRSPKGVRFFLDSEDDPNAGTGQRRTVSAMYYIDPGHLWTDGAIELQRWDGPAPPSTTPGADDFDGFTNFSASNPDINGDGSLDNPAMIWMVAGLKDNKWWELKRRGLLVDGVRMRIPAGPNGTWYSVDTRFINLNAAPTATQYLVLQIPYADPGDTDIRIAKAFEAGGPETYELELPASILPNEPGLLVDGIVIDLDGSQLPLAWRPSAQNGANYSQFMDIVFSPRGTVIGAAGSTGLIHLYVCDKVDATVLKEQFITNLPGASAVAKLIRLENGIVTKGGALVPMDEVNVVDAPWAAPLAGIGEPYLPKDRRVVTLFTQTGAISVNQIYTVDNLDQWDRDNDGNSSEPDGIADDPFLFAETGQEGN